MADPEVLIDIIESAEDIGTEHTFWSVSCRHKVHEQCRVTCAYCHTLCICDCHVPGAAWNA